MSFFNLKYLFSLSLLIFVCKKRTGIELYNNLQFFSKENEIYSSSRFHHFLILRLPSAIFVFKKNDNKLVILFKKAILAVFFVRKFEKFAC